MAITALYAQDSLSRGFDDRPYSDPQKVFGNNQTNLVLASPTHFVVANAPPILIIHGVNDTGVPVSQSVQLYHMLLAAGGRGMD